THHQEPGARSQEPERSDTMTILLVESDQAALRALRRLLEGAGYRVCAAASAEEARRVAEEERCILAGVDFSGPGVAGATVCRMLCERAPTVVLALSTGAVAGERAAAMEAGAGDYLVKPVPADRLLASVAALREGARGMKG